MTNDNAPPGEIAAAYADRYRWRVFPIHSLSGDDDAPCTCRKVGCGNVAKHPRWDDRLHLQRGCHDATVDLDLISAWWSKWPDANIGVATGVVSDLFVVDLDMKRDDDGWTGLDHFERLTSKHGPIDDTLWSRTGSGGFHCFLRYPDGVSLGNTSGYLASGIDTRGTGGYVVAPPSVHELGGRYEWWVRKRPVLPPGWLVDLLDQPRTEIDPTPVDWSGRNVERNVRSIVDTVAAGQPTNRNNLVWWGARKLAADHVVSGLLTVDEVFHLMRDAAAANGHAACHTQHQVDATIRSGIRWGFRDRGMAVSA